MWWGDETNTLKAHIWISAIPELFTGIGLRKDPPPPPSPKPIYFYARRQRPPVSDVTGTCLDMQGN